MSKKTLLITASPHKNGNTRWLARQVAESLKCAGSEVELVDAVPLRSVNRGCIGCLGCQSSKDFLCVFKDEIQPLIASMPNYDCVLFATPVYFYESPAQLKLVIDRMLSLTKRRGDTYISPFRKSTKFGLIATCGDEEDKGAGALKEVFRRIAGFFALDLETLVMPLAPMTPEEIDDADHWIAKADEFAKALVS